MIMQMLPVIYLEVSGLSLLNKLRNLGGNNE